MQVVQKTEAIILTDSTGAYMILVRIHKGKKTLGRPRLRWEDNIKMDLQDVGWESINWIYLAQNRDRQQALANEIMNLWVT
jgi:hypothetical protein